MRTLALETDYPPEEWSLRIPYDNFVLTLARDAKGEGALFEQRVGAGRILLSAGGTLFTNRALGNDDNARLMSQHRERHDGERRRGAVRRPAPGPVGELRSGAFLSRSAPLQDHFHRARAVAGVGAWAARDCVRPAIARHDPSEAELVRHAGGLIARTVAPWQQAQQLFDHFFAGVARAARGANGLPGKERGELWQWLERHAAILPQELDQLKAWYADAHAIAQAAAGAAAESSR